MTKGGARTKPGGESRRGDAAAGSLDGRRRAVQPQGGLLHFFSSGRPVRPENSLRGVYGTKRRLLEPATRLWRRMARGLTSQTFLAPLAGRATPTPGRRQPARGPARDGERRECSSNGWKRASAPPESDLTAGTPLPPPEPPASDRPPFPFRNKLRLCGRTADRVEGLRAFRAVTRVPQFE